MRWTCFPVQAFPRGVFRRFSLSRAAIASMEMPGSSARMPTISLPIALADSRALAWRTASDRACPLLRASSVRFRHWTSSAPSLPLVASAISGGTPSRYSSRIRLETCLPSL